MWSRSRNRGIFQIITVTWLIFASPLSAQVLKFEVTPEKLEPISFEMRREIAGLHYLLNVHQLRHLFSLGSDEERRQWIDRWWRSQDPVPTTPVNEMRLAHDKRVQKARLMFVWEGWPGWDHRGEVMIRYGAPDLRHGLDWDVTQAGVVPPGESWYYAQLDMTVIFEDFNLSGRYTFALDPLGNPDGRRTAGAYGPYGRQGDTSKPVDADFGPPRADMPPPPINWWYVYLSDEERKKINNFRAVLEKHPSTYPFNFDREELPFVFEIDQFKGGASLARLEVNVEFLAAPPPVRLLGETQKFRVVSAFFDEQFNLIEQTDTRISLPANVLPKSSEWWHPSQLLFSLPEDYYRVAVTVEEEGSGRTTSHRSTVLAENYQRDTAISDILFCSKIEPAQRQSPFNRGALEVVPHPRRTYVVSETVPIYFELYNLDVDEHGQSFYHVEYWLVPRAPERSRSRSESADAETYAVSRFEASGYGPDVPVDISIGTENLWAGDFEFHVRLTDQRTQFVAERTAVFHLVD